MEAQKSAGKLKLQNARLMSDPRRAPWLSESISEPSVLVPSGGFKSSINSVHPGKELPAARKEGKVAAV